MPNSSLSTIFYVSRSHTSAEEVERIVLVSRRNNALRGISGALLWTGQYFVQALEGALPALIAALKLISGDPRHSDIRILEQCALDQRRYGPWAMALVTDPSIDAMVAPLLDGSANAETFRDLRQQLQLLVQAQHRGVGDSKPDGE